MAALAAGVATSMAQNVYSLNIVGYYNVPITTPFTAMTCSLTAGSPVNRADQIIPYSDGDSIQAWNGFKFVEYDMDSGSGTGWTDPASASDVPLTALPVLTPGVGFFYGRNTLITNVTVVGTVPTGTNVFSVGTGFKMVGSMLPYAGLVSTTNASNFINCPVPDGSSVQIWNGSKFVETDRDSGSGTGWTDPASASDTTEPTLKVGQGFFSGNTSGSPFNWTQILNP
jgi:hypothetical protein